MDGQLPPTVFYATAGGQPHDTGSLGSARVVDVRSDGQVVWHTLEGAPPALGETVRGQIDWERRHQLMRTHTALHILCGVIWSDYGTAVTGGNMEPLGRVRIVDIVGLDKQADGGTHVRSTGEVGHVRVVKTESKGKGNKRIRIALS